MYSFEFYWLRSIELLFFTRQESSHTLTKTLQHTLTVHCYLIQPISSSVIFSNTVHMTIVDECDLGSDQAIKGNRVTL